MRQQENLTATDLAATSPAQLGVQEITALCSADMQRVDECIRDSLASEVVLVNQVANYIISSGGKRLRPMLLVLGARACAYEGDQHIPLAAIIEFIHTATLLHDDVVDGSDTRRGQQSAHGVWGNAASVLVGDFLYSRSFQMMVGLDSMRVMQILADTTNTIAEGEVQQLLNLGDPDVSEAAYMQVIENKTAKLFEAACRLGAVISSQSPAVEHAMANYGNCLGKAFQIADDVLDYTGEAGKLGKDIGDDLAEGKPTLPLILGRALSEGPDRELIDVAVRNGGADQLPQVLEIIHRTGALELAMERARDEARQALEALTALPVSEARDALESLASHSHARTS
jgi:octaprenyl-diphosphate synthase